MKRSADNMGGRLNAKHLGDMSAHDKLASALAEVGYAKGTLSLALRLLPPNTDVWKALRDLVLSIDTLQDDIRAAHKALPKGEDNAAG